MGGTPREGVGPSHGCAERAPYVATKSQQKRLRHRLVYHWKADSHIIRQQNRVQGCDLEHNTATVEVVCLLVVHEFNVDLKFWFTDRTFQATDPKAAHPGVLNTGMLAELDECIYIINVGLSNPVSSLHGSTSPLPSSGTPGTQDPSCCCALLMC